MKVCESCKFENQEAASYCQHCGSLLKTKGNVKRFIKSLNFGSVAGSGAKGVSVAPLTGMALDKKNNQVTQAKVTQSHSLEDGSWFCPYCGQKNKRVEAICSKCLREKS